MSLDSSSSSIWFKPDIKSRHEQDFALPNWSSMSSMQGRGNLSAISVLFIPL